MSAIDLVKKIYKQISPSYRVALRNETRLIELENAFFNSGTSKDKKIFSGLISPNDKKNLTSNSIVSLMCFANELHNVHSASFSEFKYCHTGKDVVIVATGPTMKYYHQLLNASHIGVNAAFKNENLKLDYYFVTDFENHNDWFNELKHHDFIKFFGQYSNGYYRDRFQITEQLIQENNARRFFQAAPSQDIHLDIEYYPLMGFYSIAFQALHFAIYTNPKRIFLVGCDCSTNGYFDGTQQPTDVSQPAGIPMWLRGYKKFKEFVHRFYPNTEIISINPVGLKGLFHDVYTENYLFDHPEIYSSTYETLEQFLLGETTP